MAELACPAVEVEDARCLLGPTSDDGAEGDSDETESEEEIDWRVRHNAIEVRNYRTDVGGGAYAVPRCPRFCRRARPWELGHRFPRCRLKQRERGISLPRLSSADTGFEQSDFG